MSDNVFADMGLPNPDEELLKARLVSAISQLIEESSRTQEAAGRILAEAVG